MHPQTLVFPEPGLSILIVSDTMPFASLSEGHWDLENKTHAFSS